MKSILSSNQRNGLLVNFTHATILAVILLYAQNLCALPRSPSPPYPDHSVVLYSTTFDDAYYAGQTNSELVIPGL